MQFGCLFTIKYGKNLPTKLISVDGQFPVYGAGNVIGYYAEKIIDQKVCLVTCRGNGSGTVWRTRGPAFVTNNSLLLLPQSKFSNWTYFFVELIAKHANIPGVISGSAQPQVTIDGLQSVSAVAPERRLVSEFCRLVGPMFDLVDSLYQENANLRQTRDLLLPKLISGEVNLKEVKTQAVAQGV